MRPEREHDVVAGLHIAHVRTHLLNDTRGLVTEHHREAAWVAAVEEVQVRVTHPGGCSANQHLVRRRVRGLYLLNLHGFVDFAQDGSSHTNLRGEASGERPRRPARVLGVCQSAGGGCTAFVARARPPAPGCVARSLQGPNPRKHPHRMTARIGVRRCASLWLIHEPLQPRFGAGGGT